MNVCYFGPYNPNYPRNRLMIKALKKAGLNVIECNSQSSYRFIDYVKLIKKHSSLNYDVIILGARGDYFGQPIMPLIKKITNKPVVFDSVITLYETYVVDRQLVSAGSIKSNVYYLLDQAALHEADLVLTDTKAHADYYSDFYRIAYPEVKRIPIGSDDEFFYPMDFPKDRSSFLVMFWGGFIPLQGVQYIIEAAKLLEKYPDIQFELRGFGQTYNKAIELIKTLNVNNLTVYPTWVPYNNLPSHIARADICLGIFGETEKAKRVIPNKVVESLAMKKPLITGDSSAAQEFLKNKENCLLVPMANPKAIADAILELKDNFSLRSKIAENAYKLFQSSMSPQAIGKNLKKILEGLC